MPNLSVLLNATLSVTDTTLTPSATVVQRNLNNPALAATVHFANNFFQCTGATVVALPAPTVWVVYIRNLDAAANLTVSWTPVGGAAQSFICVPGGFFFYFQPTEGAGGVTALTLTPSAGTTAADVYVAK